MSNASRKKRGARYVYLALLLQCLVGDTFLRSLRKNFILHLNKIVGDSHITDFVRIFGRIFLFGLDLPI